MGEILLWDLEAEPILPAAGSRAVPGSEPGCRPLGSPGGEVRGGRDLGVFPPPCPTVGFLPYFSRIVHSNDFIFLWSKKIDQGVWSARGGPTSTPEPGGSPRAAPGGMQGVAVHAGCCRPGPASLT